MQTKAGLQGRGSSCSKGVGLRGEGGASEKKSGCGKGLDCGKRLGRRMVGLQIKATRAEAVYSLWRGGSEWLG